MNAMDVIDFWTTNSLLFGGRDTSNQINVESIISSDTAMGTVLTAVSSAASTSISVMAATTSAIMEGTAASNRTVGYYADDKNGAPILSGDLPSSSDFILKRLARSIAFAVAKKLAESGAPDRHIASFISYLVSPFALLCMAMAIILNRTVVFATTRRPAPLPLSYRIMLRSVAIYSLGAQTVPLIRALVCASPELQTWVQAGSEDNWLWSSLIFKYFLPVDMSDSVASATATISSLPSSTVLSSLSSFFIPWKWYSSSEVIDPVISETIAASTIATAAAACPGPEILWDLYRSICIGHFIETFTSVIQGKIPYSETGMTLFEYSVAFQEVQSSQRLSVEILIVSIISSLSQLAFHIQGMLNSYKYRLIPSAFFGISFLSYFAYAVFNGRLLYFPSVCVIGYVPQLAISIVVLICGTIYGLACLFTGGPSHMQTSLQSIHIEASEDFYSCLMKLGVIALTSATKATYLTEARSLCAPLATWIDIVDDENGDNSDNFNYYGGNINEKIVGITKRKNQPFDNEVSGPPGERGGYSGRLVAKSSSARGSGTHHHNARNANYYNPSHRSRFLTTSRIISAFRMIQVLFTVALYMVWKLFIGGIRRIWPSYFRKSQAKKLRAQEFEATLMAVRNNFIYAELNDEYEGGYLRLLSGDTLPDLDDSEDYIPGNIDSSSDEDDTINRYEYESDYSSDEEDISNNIEYVSHPSQLRIPPSQLHHRKQQQLQASSSSSIPVNEDRLGSVGDFYDLVMSTPDYFLSLLAPQTSEQAEEVEILSRHLSTSTTGPLTRSKYHESHRDDVRDIIQIIRDRRRRPLNDNHEDEEDATAAALRGTLCVVCQTSPRQVVLWPCRCFALCEECRVALAFKHFKGCVCCRREVESFSRIFVP